MQSDLLFSLSIDTINKSLKEGRLRFHYSFKNIFQMGATNRR